MIFNKLFSNGKKVEQEGIYYGFPVIDLFQSIQGEGFFLGSPATFIRLSGCNLTCSWCDTKESWDSKNVEVMSLELIASKCKGIDLVIITGGEPCLNKNLQTLVTYLQRGGHYVCIETNGTLPTPTADWITVSPKPEVEYRVHPKCTPNELKFVVSDELDFEKHVLPWLMIEENQYNTCWLQPEGSTMQASAQKALEWVMKYPNYNLRLGIQMHKIFNLK